MKKFFTMIAAAFMAVGVNAQEVEVDTLFETTASVYLLGLDKDATRTLVALSDSSYIIKEMYGEGSSDVRLKVDKSGRVDFYGTTMDSYYYTYNTVTGSEDVTSICAYAAYYYSSAMNHNSEYYKAPDKFGGELIIPNCSAFKGQDYVGKYNQDFYVCWGTTRLYGTKEWKGVASLVYTPAEGTQATDGTWAESKEASIGFYYDELTSSTVYCITNFYGGNKDLNFSVTEKGKLGDLGKYAYTGNEAVYCLEPNADYSYTWGDDQYYVTDLTKVRNGEVGFFAYAYTPDGNATGATDWQKNYYVFYWENTDIEDPAGISTTNASLKSTNTAVKTVKGIRKNGKMYNYAGQLIK